MAGTEKSGFWVSDKVQGLIYSVVTLLVELLVFWLIGSLFNHSHIKESNKLREWLDAPISQLKTWHLLVILWVIGILTRDK